MFDTYKRYYTLRLYTKEDMAKFVAGGKITAEQYTEITGDTYVAPVINSKITKIETNILKNTAAFSFTTKLLDKKIDDLEIKVDGGGTNA